MSPRTQLLTHEKITLMLSMVPYLLQHGATPMSELAQRFDVDPATVRSIVRFFGVAGIPGETSTYQHEDLFDIDWDALELRDEALLIRTVVVSEHPQFSPREVAALLAGLQYLRSIPTIVSPQEVELLMKKLTQATGQVTSRITVHEDTAPEGVSKLHAAMQSGDDVSFHYVDMSSNSSERTAAPLRIEAVDDVWYLRAVCQTRGGERLFRVDRMSDIHAISATASSHTAPVLGEKSGETTVLFSPGEDAEEVTVYLHAAISDTLRRFDPIIEENTAKVLLAELSRSSRLAAAGGGATEVLSPPEARSMVRDWAQKALDQYDE